MGLSKTMIADFKANPRDGKARLILVAFRLAHALRTGSATARILSVPYIIFYRLLTEWVMGVELRPRTSIGPGLTIYHGVGIVINDGAVIGSGVVLRQNVTIGQAVPGGPSPVIEDQVTFGAGAMVMGGVTIGKGANIGAGAIVTADVPPGGVARAAKARIYLPRASSSAS
jgi:serine O-acetyltransferase/putative colanic acid biosynthesis acetyltransferase WcaB